MNAPDKIVLGDNVRAARDAVRKQGYFLIPDAYSPAFCESVKAFIDAQQGPDVEYKYGGTEKRCWRSHLKSHVDVDAFFREATAFASGMAERRIEPYDMLAYSCHPVKEGDVDNVDGRWHYDSWSHQLKIFIYLTDTTERSGPFEFFPRTNGWFRWRLLFRNGYLFDYARILDRENRQKYRSFSEDKIAEFIAMGHSSVPVLVKAGTVLVVNPSVLLHRARPCMEGNRYVLAAYLPKVV